MTSLSFGKLAFAERGGNLARDLNKKKKNLSRRGSADIVLHSPRDTDMRLPGAGPASPLQAIIYRPLPCDLGMFKRYSMECVQPLCHFIDRVLCVPLLELFAVQARAGEIFVGAVLAPRQIGL
eukprot:COSAG01_NODE_10807_length_2075_cov_80.497976_1_plen_122_part_10